MSQRIAVTGCNGRVGKRVIKLALEEGHQVVGIDRTPLRLDESIVDALKARFTFICTELIEFDKVLAALEGCEAVIHLAAFANPRDYKVETHNLNVVLSWNILRACAELGIHRVAQASSVNVITMAYRQSARIYYFPIDEDHPCEPDEPYGLSKLVCEMQADTILRRYHSMKIASLRLHWCIPTRSMASEPTPGRVKDLFGYVHIDDAAKAFLLAISPSNDKWTGHERFFIAAPHIACDEDTATLLAQHYPDVPFKNKEGFVGRESLFDCSKASRLLGWAHENNDS